MRKSIAAITFKRGSQGPVDDVKANDALCRLAENTCLCEKPHKAFGGPRINENHRAFKRFIDLPSCDFA